MHGLNPVMATRAIFVTLLLALTIGGLAGAMPPVFSPRPAQAAEGPPLAGVFAENFEVSDPAEPAPDVAFTDLEGLPASLADFAGEVVLLNFWATWCAPCVREMPSLDRLQAQLAPQGLKVVALSMDRKGRQLVEPFMEKLGLENLQAFLDPKGRAARAFGVHGLPSSYVIDAEGRLAGSLLGPAEWDEPEAIELLRYYLNQAQGADRRSASQSD